MTTPFRLALLAPADCSPAELRAFYRLTRDSSPVNRRGLRGRIRAARLLAFAWRGTELVAIAALKTPRPAYHRGVFASAGLGVAGVAVWPTFPTEYGYAVTHPRYQGQGLAGALLAALLKGQPRGLYATTSQPAMAHLLRRAGFNEVGQSYPGHQGTPLSLFVR